MKSLENHPMSHARYRWNRSLPLTIVFGLLTTGLILSCGQNGGGGSGSSSIGLNRGSGTGTVLVTGRLLTGPAASPPTKATPDHVKLAVQNAAISMQDLAGDYLDIVSGPVDADFSVDGTSFSDGASFESKSDVPAGIYRSLRLIVSEMSWNASWTSSNPSPCNPTIVNGDSGWNPVDLGNHTDYYFKTPDLGGNTLAYYITHPLVSGYVGDANHPLVMAAPIQVLKDTPTTINLVIGVTDALTCDSLGTFDRSNGGAKATLAGPATKLMGAEEVYFDPVHQEIGVTNGGNNSVSVYDRAALNDSGQNDVAPTRILNGPDTRLSGPAGIAVYLDSNDSDNDEIIVANTDNDDLTVYSRTAFGNAAPLRILTGSKTGISRPKGIYLDTARDEISVANSGNNSVTIHSRNAAQNAFPYRIVQGDLTGLSNPCGVIADADFLYVANRDSNTVTIYRRNDVTIGPDNVNSLVGVSKGYPSDISPVREPGGFTSKTFRLDFPETVTSPDIKINVGPSTKLTEVRDGINLNPDNYELSPGIHRVAATITTTSPYRLIIVSNLISRASNVTVDGTLLDEIPDFFTIGDVRPVRTITGLSSPCGLYLDTANNEIGVGNSGNGTVNVYNRGDVLDLSQYPNGNIPPRLTVPGLKTPRGLYLDATHDEIGVIQTGPSVVMAQRPPIFPAATDGNGSPAPLAGDYNVVLFSVEDHGVDGNGDPNPVVFSERGTATFDSSVSPWPSFNLQLDTQAGVQIRSSDCLPDSDVGIIKTGFYGTNQDGSFYAFLPGIHGSLHGGIVPDGSVFVGSMVDNSKKMMLVYGTKATGANTPYLSSNGTNGGGQAYYAYADYRSSTYKYELGIGITETDASYFLSRSGDVDYAALVTANSIDLEFKPNSFDLKIPNPESYTSSPGGLVDNPSDGMAGSATMDGGALIFARKGTSACPSEIGFGMALRQRPAGTFTTSSIKGTYMMASLGDRLITESNNNLRRHHRSTMTLLNFNGAGSVEITEIQNADGMISTNKAVFTYQVNRRDIPNNGTLMDVVDIYNNNPIAGPFASGLIGQGGKTLSIFRSLSFGNTYPPSPNPLRLLGLAVFQHS